MKLFGRILIFILIELGISVFLFFSFPSYDEDDLYLVSGNCLDIEIEKGGGKHSFERVYVRMDDGERYYIHKDVWRKLGDARGELVGKDIAFFASDKAWHWHFEHLIIFFGEGEADCRIVLTETNRENILHNIFCSIFFAIVLFLPIVGPEILRVMEKRDEALAKRLAAEKRARKKMKREQKRQKFDNMI